MSEGVDEFANLMLVRSGDLTREAVVTVTTTDGTATGNGIFLGSKSDGL